MADEKIRKAGTSPIITPKTLGTDLPGPAQDLFSLLTDNVKPIATGVVLAIVIVAVWFGIDAWRDKRVAEARVELGKILVMPEENDRLQALETFATKAPDAVRTPAMMELARENMEAKRYDRAAAAWDSLGKSGDGDLRIVAAFGRATSLTAQGKGAEALAVLDGVKGSLPEGYAPVFNQQKAVSAESAGNWQAAIDAYNALKASDSLSDKAFYDYKIAELQARLK